MPDDDLTTLGGYRLVRRLGSGSRADVYLGAASSGSVALKIYRETTPPDDIGRELDALGRLDSDHCVRLVDVVTAASGLPAAILARVERGSAAQLFRERESIEAGEAVTLLAPIVGAVRAAHVLGVAHSRLGAASVYFGAGGEPVLVGFGHVQLFGITPSVAVLDADPVAEQDREALASFVSLTLSHVRGAASNGRIAELTAWIGASTGNRRLEFADDLESHLFDLAEPLAIEFGRVPSSVPLVPARVGVPQAPVEMAAAPGATSASHMPDKRPTPSAADVGDVGVPAERSDAAEVAQGWVPDWLHEAIMTNPGGVVRARVVNSLRDVRKPVWVVTAAVAVALVTAILVVPQGASSVARADQPQSQSPGGPASSAKPGTHLASPVTKPTALPADPVAALPLLLAQRTRCVADRSVLCLAAVDEATSEALATDTTLIRSLQAGGELPVSARVVASAPALVERLGDSALVSLGPKSIPASALMIKEKAGWRIRSFQSGKPSKSSGGD